MCQTEQKPVEDIEESYFRESLNNETVAIVEYCI